MRKFNFDANQAANFLSLLANAKRLEVLELIAKQERDVTSLAEAVHLSQSALSQHLKSFVMAGWSRRREKRRRFATLSDRKLCCGSSIR